MKKAELVRTSTSDQGTPGRLTLEGGFTCCTLELPWRGNKDNLSRIQIGVYICKKRFSWHFVHFLYEIKDVCDRDNILIHQGNFAGDTTKGYKSDVEGCILLGARISKMIPEGFAKTQMAVVESKDTLAKFMEAAAGEDLELTVRDEWETA